MQCAEALSKFVFRDGSSTLLANVFANDKRCAGKNPPDRLYWRVIDLPGCCGAVVLLRWWCPGLTPTLRWPLPLHSGQRQGHRQEVPCLDISDFAGWKGLGRKVVDGPQTYAFEPLPDCENIVVASFGARNDEI